jgi:hypothetical protein
MVRDTRGADMAGETAMSALLGSKTPSGALVPNATSPNLA